MGHQGQEGVEFQAARGAGQGQGGIVADHQHGRLADRLGNDRIDLARHDGGAGLTPGQTEFSQAGIRARN